MISDSINIIHEIMKSTSRFEMIDNEFINNLLSNYDSERTKKCISHSINTFRDFLMANNNCGYIKINISNNSII